MTEFTINRKTWMTPNHPQWENIDGNCLYNPDEQTMCCLGFYCNRVARIKKEELEFIGVPSDLPEEYKQYLDKYVYKPTIENIIKFEDDLANINDDLELFAKEREKKISQIFKKAGYKVKFIGEYAKQ